MDYGKLAEQYGSFLVAIGGVSITVLTLVISIWHFRPASATPSQNDEGRSALIKALMIAMFCSFVGAHLMAETAAFIAGHDKGFGAKQFLLGSVNIFNAVTVLMFAVMLLATEYKKENQKLPGIRSVSAWVFRAVVICVLWWMVVSILWRMPPPHWGWAVGPFVLIVMVMGVIYAYIRQKGTKKKWALLRFTFWLIIGFTLCSLISFSCSLTDPKGAVFRLFSLISFSGSLPVPKGDEISGLDAIFFVSTITITSASLLCVSLPIKAETPAGKFTENTAALLGAI